MNQIISVIIPAFNEEASIGLVVNDIPKEIVKHVIVVNNGSTDNTVEVAKKAGAIKPLRLNRCCKGNYCSEVVALAASLPNW